jgi:hypothetical protein
LFDVFSCTLGAGETKEAEIPIVVDLARFNKTGIDIVEMWGNETTVKQIAIHMTETRPGTIEKLIAGNTSLDARQMAIHMVEALIEMQKTPWQAEMGENVI